LRVGVDQAERVPAYQVLAEDLRAQITSGRLRPGDRLPAEPQLCALSGVSRSTVREALRLLASQNLIVTVRGVTGGSFVAEPSSDRLADALTLGVRLLISAGHVDPAHIFEVREAFEVPASGIAALRRTDEHLAALRAALFDPDSTDPEAMSEAQRTFHLGVAAATGNPLFGLITRPLYGVRDEWEGAHRVAGFWRAIDSDHRRILAAIAARDPDAARAAARAHLADLRERRAPD
jgi:GntR family transcriptional regulator, transcriptional repressor for pyruvate dehydrogenase complex